MTKQDLYAALYLVERKAKFVKLGTAVQAKQTECHLFVIYRHAVATSSEDFLNFDPSAYKYSALSDPTDTVPPARPPASSEVLSRGQNGSQTFAPAYAAPARLTDRPRNK